MKHFLTVSFLLIIALFGTSCHTKTKNSTNTNNQCDSSLVENKTQSDYTFNTPGWTQEIHPFPLDFAPGIPFTGYADVRFPFGWGNPGSDEFCGAIDHLLCQPSNGGFYL